MQLFALTGARANEIVGFRREELRDGAILLPGSRTKNGREHLIFLLEPARAVLAAMLGQHKDEERSLVFGPPHRPVQRLVEMQGLALDAAHRSKPPGEACWHLGTPHDQRPQIRDPRRWNRHPAAHRRSVPEPRQRPLERCRQYLQQGDLRAREKSSVRPLGRTSARSGRGPQAPESRHLRFRDRVGRRGGGMIYPRCLRQSRPAAWKSLTHFCSLTVGGSALLLDPHQSAL